MAVEVIDKIKPKNGGSFPVVEAVDVAVSDELRLPEALAAKANAADVTSATSNLQSQIDQIAQAAGTGSADTEVAQARVGADGTVYTTLKDRIDGENEQLKDDISPVIKEIYSSDNTVDGKYYDDEGQLQESQYWSICKISVSAYKRVIYAGVTHLVDTIRSVFLDSSDNVITTFPMSSGENVVDVPDNAVYVVFTIHTAEKSDFSSFGINKNVFLNDSETVEHNNYFNLDSFSESGVTCQRNSDNTITLSGTASATLDITVSVLNTGTYVALFSLLSGTISSASDVSIRVNDSRWVNNRAQVETRQISGITEVKFRISSGVTMTNAKIAAIIKDGTDVNATETWNYSAVDSKARELIEKNADDIADNKELIDTISYKSQNLFYLTEPEQTISGLTISADEKGRVIINGTSQGSVKLVLMGAASTSDTNLPKGTYTAKIERVSGTISTAGNISLRYGAVSSSSGTRWVISTTPVETDSFDSDQSVILYISPDTEFTDATYELQIEQGETVGDFYPYGFLTGFDVVARDKIAEIEAEITDVPELSLTDFEYELIGGGLSALNSLYGTTGKLFNASYITDTHIDIYQNTRHGEDSFKLFNSITNYCDISVHMGDVVQSTNRTLAEALHNFEIADYLMRDAKSCIICRGNHDTNIRAGYPINTAVFNTMEKRRLPYGFVSNPNDTNKMYGYMDFPQYKLRVYILDCYDDLTLEHSGSSSAPYNDAAIITERQLEWLFVQNALSDTTWTALIFSHNSLGSTLKYEEAESKNCSFRTKLAAMIDNGVPVVLCHGNNHKDAWASVVCGNSSGCALDITFEQAFYNFNDSEDISKGYYYDDHGNLIQKDLYCLGFISLDTENHIIYDTRIGRGQSRALHYGTSDTDIYEISN